MLSDGLVLMVIGMGTVFIFLVLMIYCMHFMLWVLEKVSLILPEPAAKTVLAVARPIVSAPSTSNNSKLKQIAIAIAAIKARR